MLAAFQAIEAVCLLVRLLQSFYFEKKPALSNEEFDNLKEELLWEGSKVAILRCVDSLAAISLYFCLHCSVMLSRTQICNQQTDDQLSSCFIWSLPFLVWKPFALFSFSLIFSKVCLLFETIQGIHISAAPVSCYTLCLYNAVFSLVYRAMHCISVPGHCSHIQYVEKYRLPGSLFLRWRAFRCFAGCEIEDPARSANCTARQSRLLWALQVDDAGPPARSTHAVRQLNSCEACSLKLHDMICFKMYKA